VRRGAASTLEIKVESHGKPKAYRSVRRQSRNFPLSHQSHVSNLRHTANCSPLTAHYSRSACRILSPANSFLSKRNALASGSTVAITRSFAFTVTNTAA